MPEGDMIENILPKKNFFEIVIAYIQEHQNRFTVIFFNKLYFPFAAIFCLS